MNVKGVPHVRARTRRVRGFIWKGKLGSQGEIGSSFSAAEVRKLLLQSRKFLDSMRTLVKGSGYGGTCEYARMAMIISELDGSEGRVAGKVFQGRKGSREPGEVLRALRVQEAIAWEVEMDKVWEDPLARE